MSSCDHDYWFGICRDCGQPWHAPNPVRVITPTDSGQKPSTKEKP